MFKFSRAITVMGVCGLLILGSTLPLIAQDEPDLPDPVVPVFAIPQADTIPQFVIPALETTFTPETDPQFPIAEDVSGAYMPTELAPAQTASTFYWPFETNTTGQLYNYADSAWTRAQLGIAACPPLSQRASYGIPYCYAGNQGIDIRLPQTGVNVLAARSGYIVEVRNACTFSGSSATEPANCPSGGSLPWTYGNFVKMKHDDGSYSFYTHLQKDSMLSPSETTRIEVGTKIALVGNTGNISEPRLHFQVWNSSNAWIDPYEQNLWVRQNGQIVAAADAFKLNPDERVAVLLGDNRLFVKQGNLTADWSLESASSGHFQLAGSRIALMDTSDDLYIKDVSVSSGWQLLRQDIVSFQLDGSRIGVLLPNHEFYVKEGVLTAPWVLQSNTAISFQLAGTRMGLIDTANDLYVKEDGGTWTLVREDVQSFQLEGNRIGVLLPNNEFYVKEGALNADWTLQSNTAIAFQMNETRLAVLDKVNDLYIKEGALTSPWVLVLSKVKDFQLEGMRIGALQTNHNFYVKEGALNSSWYLQSDTAVAFQLYQDRMALIDIANGMYAKEGGLTAAWLLLREGVMDFQVAARKPDMAEPLPPAPAKLDLIAPKGTVSDSHGYPVYEWSHMRGATSYQIYVAPADDLYATKFFGYIPARAYCEGASCKVDLTQIKASAWLIEERTYTVYLKASNGEWVDINTPFKFTISEPQPTAVTPTPATNTNTLTPFVTWKLEGDAAYAAFFQVYVAPVTNLAQPAYYKWVLREQVCGSKQGVSCMVQMPQLTDNTQYNFYIQSWGPGGFSTGGNVQGVDGWSQGTFTVKTS